MLCKENNAKMQITCKAPWRVHAVRKVFHFWRHDGQKQVPQNPVLLLAVVTAWREPKWKKKENQVGYADMELETVKEYGAHNKLQQLDL